MLSMPAWLLPALLLFLLQVGSIGFELVLALLIIALTATLTTLTGPAVG